MLKSTRFIGLSGAMAAGMLLVGVAQAGTTVCTVSSVSRIDSARDFCACERISQAAIYSLRRSDNFESILQGASSQCPAWAILLRGDEVRSGHGARADGAPAPRPASRPKVGVTQVASVGSTPQAPSTPGPSSPTDTGTSSPTDPGTPTNTTPSGRPRDDNGHGNDTGNVDPSNPGGKK